MIDLFFPCAGFVSGSIPCSYLAARLVFGKGCPQGRERKCRRHQRFSRCRSLRRDRRCRRGRPQEPAAGARVRVCAGSQPLWQVLTAAAVIAGHCYSPFLKFRGGKGVASTITVSLVLCWPAALAFGAVWLGVFFTRGYVSLASILASFALPLGSALAHADRIDDRFLLSGVAVCSLQAPGERPPASRRHANPACARRTGRLSCGSRTLVPVRNFSFLSPSIAMGGAPSRGAGESTREDATGSKI